MTGPNAISPGAAGIYTSSPAMTYSRVSEVNTQGAVYGIYYPNLTVIQSRRLHAPYIYISEWYSLITRHGSMTKLWLRYGASKV